MWGLLRNASGGTCEFMRVSNDAMDPSCIYPSRLYSRSEPIRGTFIIRPQPIFFGLRQNSKRAL